ncbi:MAG: DEAD/DEAH box helicase [Bacteroidota bacterium]
MSEILIEIDKASFLCKVLMEDLSDAERRELRFLVINRWEEVEYRASYIELDWYKLKRILPAFASWCKTRNVKIIFDDYLQNLVKKFAQDKRGFQGEICSFPDNNDNIQLNLNKLNFNRQLTDKQIEDVSRLLKLYHGANFSVPGAGKTTSILAVFTLLKNLGVVNKMLVICPINAFISWEDEVEEIFKGTISVTRLNKGLIEDFSPHDFPDTDIYITNYEKFRGSISGIIKLFTKNKMHLVLDESHRIKSGFSNQSYSQIIKLGDSSMRRDIMSGTPMPQSYNDISSQFDFIWPTERILPVRLDAPNTAQIIHQNIRNFYVRTTKKDLELEPVSYISTEVEMGPIQRELYNLLRSESARILTSMERQNINTFRFLGRSVVRLMQASTNPMLLTGNEDIYDEVEGIPSNSEVWEVLEDYSRYEKPAKFLKLQERVSVILSSDKDAKVLIWSIFVKNILLLKELFSQYNPAVIYGGVSSSGDDNIEESREGQIRKFHLDNSCRVMIANPQACGEGISLHKVCHHAIYLERNYNAAHFLQSMDRIHRFGLKPGTETKIELLLAKNSLDSRIDDRLREKIAAMSAVLEDPFLERMAYDPYDIIDESGVGLDNKDIDDIRSYFAETK